MMRAWRQRARMRHWLTLALLTGAVGSCGGSATSHPSGGSAGAASGGSAGAAASAGGDSSGASGPSASGSSGETTGAAPGSPLGDGGEGSAGTSSGGSAGSDAGSAGQDDSSAGSGGERADCVDVCELRGEACCVPESCVGADASCVIEVFDQRVSITNEYGKLEQIVATLPPVFSATMSTADVVSSAADPIPTARFELRLSASASALDAAALADSDLHPFRVSCAGQRLFVGLVYRREGAAALAVPVLHVAQDVDDAIVLQLGAWQGAWLFPSRNDENLAARARLDRPELRTTLCLSGAPLAL